MKKEFIRVLDFFIKTNVVFAVVLIYLLAASLIEGSATIMTIMLLAYLLAIALKGLFTIETR